MSSVNFFSFEKYLVLAAKMGVREREIFRSVNRPTLLYHTYK